MTAVSTPGRLWLARAGQVGVWVLLAVACVGAVKSLAFTPAPTVVEPSGPVVAPDIAAAGLAELFVAHWLAGRDLDGFGADLPSAGEPAAVSSTATVAMAPHDDGWTITVAAQVTPPVADDEPDPTATDNPSSARALVDAAGETRFYRVPVAGGDAPQVVGLPAQVAAPPVRDDVADGGQESSGTVALDPVDRLPADVVDTLDGFAAGLLAGSGSLDRYLTTGAAIDPVDPAPFAAVELDAAAVVEATETNAVLVLRVVGLDDRSRPVHDLEYRLVLSRGDRWEVAALH